MINQLMFDFFSLKTMGILLVFQFIIVMTFRHFLMKPIKILEDMLPVPTEEELKIHME